MAESVKRNPNMPSTLRRRLTDLPADLKNMPPDLSAVWEWFTTSPEGRAIQRAAREERRRVEDREAAFSRWLAAEKKRERLPALREKERTAATRFREAYEDLRGKWYRASVDLHALEREIDHEQGRAEIVLRETSDPLFSDYGPVRRVLDAARSHLGTHMGLGIADDRQLLADHRRLGINTPLDLQTVEAAKRRVELADKAAELREAVDRAIESLRAAQLKPNPDISKLMGEIFAKIPAKCPCGEAFDFSGVPEVQEVAT